LVLTAQRLLERKACIVLSCCFAYFRTGSGAQSKQEAQEEGENTLTERHCTMMGFKLMSEFANAFANASRLKSLFAGRTAAASRADESMLPSFPPESFFP
jgi:hypothetical protein